MLGGMRFAEHKRARFDYELLEEYEAGIELSGHEVKAVRAGRAQLDGAHIIVRGAEAYLVGATIAPYQPANAPTAYDPTQARRLLLSHEEISELNRAGDQRGLTVVPIAMYSKGRNIKLSLAIARGKKQADKRESIKKRDTKRDIERTLKTQAT